MTAVAMLSATLGLSACSNPTGKSWAITYEVTTDGPGTVSAVDYTQSPNRYDHQVKHTDRSGPLGLPWKEEVVVTAGETATVTAEPNRDDTALSCRVLLDDEKPLAEATAPAPGEPVTCGTTTRS